MVGVTGVTVTISLLTVAEAEVVKPAGRMPSSPFGPWGPGSGEAGGAAGPLGPCGPRAPGAPVSPFAPLWPFSALRASGVRSKSEIVPFLIWLDDVIR